MASATSIGGVKGCFYNTGHVLAHATAALTAASLINRLAIAIFGKSDNAQKLARILALAAGLATSIYLVPKLLPTAGLVSFTGMQAFGWSFLPIIGTGALPGYFGAPYLYLWGTLGALQPQ